MADENLQYTVTFKTRSEGDGAQKQTAAVRDLRTETDRLNQLNTPEKTRSASVAYYDLTASINTSTTAVKANYRATDEGAFARVRARQASAALIDQLKQEELAKRKLAAATPGAAKGQRDLGMATLEASRAFEDMQYGLRGALNNLPVLIGMLGGSAGLAGAVSIGAVVISLFASKLEKLEQAAKSSGEAAETMKEKLIELAAAMAAQEVDLYISRLEQAEQMTNDIADAEVRRIALAAEQAAAMRKVEASQDLLTGAAMEYLSALGGIEVLEQRRQLKQREADREQANQLDSQQVRIDQARKSYENLTAEIERMKAALADASARKDSLEVDRAKLERLMENSRSGGRKDEAASFEVELQPILADLKRINDQLANLPKQIDSLTAEAFAQAVVVDETLASAQAQMDAINAEFANKAAASELAATVEGNRQIVTNLSAALDDFKATTPAQAEAAAAIAAAVADGKLSTQELATLAGQVQALGPEFTAAIQAMGGTVDKLILAVQQLAAKQRDADKKVEGILNGIR
jgi:hypothetical protein